MTPEAIHFFSSHYTDGLNNGWPLDIYRFTIKEVRIHTYAHAHILSGDFVTVSNPDLMGGEETFCGDQSQLQGTELYNGGTAVYILVTHITLSHLFHHAKLSVLK